MTTRFSMSESWDAVIQSTGIGVLQADAGRDVTEVRVTVITAHWFLPPHTKDGQTSGVGEPRMTTLWKATKIVVLSLHNFVLYDFGAGGNVGRNP